ncbi:hypothetical protein AB0G85_37440 [Streptomyces sioyaensis]
MSSALQEERPDDAKGFDFDTLRAMGWDLVPGLKMRRVHIQPGRC